MTYDTHCDLGLNDDPTLARQAKAMFDAIKSDIASFDALAAETIELALERLGDLADLRAEATRSSRGLLAWYDEEAS